MLRLHHSDKSYYVTDDDTGEVFAFAEISYKGCKTKKVAYEKLFTELFKQIKELEKK